MSPIAVHDYCAFDACLPSHSARGFRRAAWVAVFCIFCGSATAGNWFVSIGHAAPPAEKQKSKLVDWTPMPIEWPKAEAREFTSDDKMRATEGKTWPGVGKKVTLVKFGPPEAPALVALADGTCHVVDPLTGESRQTWEIKNKRSPLAQIEITVDGRRSVLRYEHQKGVDIRDMADGKLLRTIGINGADTTLMALGNDPRLLVLTDMANRTRLWNLENGEQLGQVTDMPRNAVSALALSSDCRELYVAVGLQNFVNVYDLPDCTRQTTIELADREAVRLTLTSSANFLLTLSKDRTLEAVRLKGATDEPLDARYSMHLRHGNLGNCFLLRSGEICNYLGGTSFEYLDPISAGTAGSCLSDARAISEVAVRGDGRLAATGLPDGSVHFYELPGQGQSAGQREIALGKQLLKLLDEKNYDALDELANQALAQTQFDSRRHAPASLLRDSLCSPERYKNGDTFEGRLERLHQWRDAKPKSRAATVTLAMAYNDYGWAMRGTKWAALTPPEAMARFQVELEKADHLFRAADAMGPANAQISASWLATQMGLSTPRGDMLKTWQRGCQDSPVYFGLHTQMSHALLPRWGGEFGDVAKFARRVLKDLPGDAGLLAYAAIAEHYVQYESPMTLVVAGFDLDEMERGAEAQLKAYPDTDRPARFAALVACLRHDRVAAAERFDLMGHRYAADVWKHAPTFQKFYAWSRVKSGPTTHRAPFLGTFHGLPQVAFTGEGNGLLVVGHDSVGQLHVWDLDDEKRQSMRPVPSGLSVWVACASGKRIVCTPPTGEQGVVLVDVENGKRQPWLGVTTRELTVISSDEKEFLFCNAKRAAAYDLENLGPEPTKVVPLKAPPTAVAIPSVNAPWGVAACERDGTVRLLSESGEEMAKPVKMPRFANRLRPIPATSRLVAMGVDLLGVVDLEKSEFKLFGEGPGKRSANIYSAIITTHDGTLLAAALRTLNGPIENTSHSIEIWDLAQAQRLRTLEGHDVRVVSLAFSADNQRLASADEAGFVQLWDMQEIGK